jgi:hypothetical protein
VEDADGGFKWPSQHLDQEVVRWVAGRSRSTLGPTRGQMPSPGRPTVAWREDRVRFWAAIARGLKTEDAATEVGVSGPVVFR